MSAAREELTGQLTEAISEPKLAALILAKVSLAAERDVRLRLMPDSRVGQRVTGITQVLTVAGNLIDNAIDAAALGPAPREVELTLVAAESDLLVRVRDTGPGVPHDMREAIFTDGVTPRPRRRVRAAVSAWPWSGRSWRAAAAWSASATTTAPSSPRCCPAACRRTREHAAVPEPRVMS